ncbi:MAG: hypothetical protein GXO10_06275 [Crenarchaeota archaeon]|nr:hypothetical protein [Thermoproteota archaeon]
MRYLTVLPTYPVHLQINKYLYSYRDYKLLPVPYNKIDLIPKNKNFVSDNTYAEQLVINRYLKTTASYRADRAIKLLSPLYTLYQNRTNVLWYIIDRNNPFNLSIYRKVIWILLSQWQYQKKRVYDYAFLVLLPGPVCIKILDPEHPVNTIRVLNLLRQIRPINKTTTIEVAANEVVANSNIPKEYEPAIKTFMQQHPDITEQFLANKIPSTRIAVAALEYKISGNDKLAKAIVYAKKPITSDDLNKVVTRYKDLITTTNITLSKPTDPVISKVNTTRIVDNKTGQQLFEYRTQDYTNNLQQDLKNTFKELESAPFPCKLKKLTFEPYTSPNNIRRSDLVKAHIVIEDDLGNEHDVSLLLPRLNNNRFILNNKPYIIINQLMIMPIFFLKPHVVKITTSFATVTLYYKFPLKSNAYYQIYISGYKLELGPVLAYLQGLEPTLKLFGIVKYSFENIKPTDKNQVYYQIGDKFLYINQDLDNMQRAILNSFTRVPSIKSQYPITSKDYWTDVIIDRSGSRSFPTTVTTIWRRILDQATIEVLKARHQPTTMPAIIVYCCKGILDPNRVDTRNDLTKQRIRNSEIITQYVLKHLSIAYSTYMTQRQLGDTKAKIKLDPKAVLNDILADPNVQAMDQINPIEELAVVTRISPTGIGGLPTKEAITVEYRNIHPSYYGNIDPTDTPEGGTNVGALQHLALDTALHARGIISSKQLNNALKTGILSTSSAMVPFLNHNDGARCMFSANQQRSAVPLLHKEVPLVQSGYEGILSSFVSSSFIKRAPCNGTVISVARDDSIIIECDKTKELKRIDIEPDRLRSGLGKHGFSQFTPLVKPGTRVKQSQPLAEGASIKNGLIATGVNLLTCLIPYKGFNYDDAIVISEDLVTNNKLTSVHYDVITVQIEPNSRIKYVAQNGDTVRKGYPIISFVPANIANYIDVVEEDIDEVSSGVVSINADTTGTIFKIECYGPTSTPVTYPELREIYEQFSEQYKKEHPSAKSVPTSWKWGSKPIKGVVLRFHIRYQVPIGVGDKLCNRHGNKGVVGKILPANLMPTCQFGRVEIIFNPLGVISRMNIGQILELYSGLIAKKLNWTLPTLPYDKGLALLRVVCETISDKNPTAPMMQLYTSLSKMSPKQWLNLMDQIRANETVIPILAPPFNSPNVKAIINTLKVLKLRTKYPLYLPEFNSKAKRPVPVGYMYVNKLEHIAAWKLAARSTRTYVSQTLQPPRGKSKQGGQRLGELESWGFFSWGAEHLFNELYGPLSDDHSTKAEIITEIIEKGQAKYRPPKIRPTRDAFLALLAGLHIKPF